MRKLLFISLAFLSLLFYSCETEVDIIGDYKETTIVYGLLNQDSTTFVRVNKAFLGKGNALTMAKIEDSSSYNNITVQMDEWKGEQLLRTIDLHDTIIDYKEDGIFYNPYQKLYYTQAELNENFRYELKVVFPDERENVTASTEMIHDIYVDRPPVGLTTINFVTTNTLPNDIRWYQSENAHYYEVTIRFNYKEKFVNQPDTVLRYIDWKIGNALADNKPVGAPITLSYFTKNFYALCEERIPYEDAAKEQQVLTRTSAGVDFIFQVASEDFYTYLEVNGASGSIVQDRPQYTNIQNGLGIFASRYIKRLHKTLHMDTQFQLEEMNLKFVPN